MSHYFHKVTTMIARAKLPSKVVIEGLNVRGMMKNHKLSKSIGDSSFNLFKSLLAYKCLWAGIELQLADRFYPSSKRCSDCGNIKEDLKLSDRVYKCDACGLEIDRDLNASCNLRDYTDSMSGIKACGDDKVHSTKSRRWSSEKQESNIKIA